MTDLELLKQYGEQQSQQAYAELVRRHLDWVYGAAIRRVHDRELAQDVTQAVFIALTRQVKSLVRDQSLSPWLLRVTRCAAISAMRAENRRRHHEQKAAAMRPERIAADQEAQWDQVAPLLDDQVLRLGKKDKEVILLRFYEQRPLADVGKRLGISEKAAQKRVERAVEKLRGMLEKKGVSGTAGLSAVLVGNVVREAPASLVEGIMKAVGGGNPVASAIAKGAMKMMTMAKIKVAVAAFGLLVAGAVALPPLLAQQTSGQSAPAVKPAVTVQASPYVARLANGLTLEVVGLSYHPSAGRPWWRPDGSPLPDRPYQRMEGVGLVAAGSNAREVAVRIINAPADPATVRWSVTPGPGQSGSGSILGARSDSVQALAVAWGTDPSNLDVVFHVAAGPWWTAATGQATSMATSGLSGAFVFSDPVETDGGTRICIADSHSSFDHRFVATDRQNRPHSPARQWGSSAGQIGVLNVQFSDLRPREVAEIAVQLRPFDTTVRFGNIAMNPGQTTQVKVEAQGPTTSKTNGADQFP